MIAKASSWLRQKPWNSFLARWLGFSLFFHGLAAVFSYGYYDADEQFQILEFLAARLGRTPFDGLAWEYQRRMRSWFQPMLYETPVRALQAAGVHDPFYWALSARLLSALIGWLSLVALARCCEKWFEDPRWRQWAVRLTCLFWFLPYLHARTSAESLGGSLFLLGIALFTLRKGAPGSALTGALLGLSFLCRFQMGIAIAAFAIWLVAVERVRDRRLLWLGGAFAAATALGLGLDAWGYGRWVLTPWNYFNENLIQGAAASIGRSPWDDYFRLLWQQLPPLGAIVLLATAAGWIARPLNVLSFTSLAFVAGHCWLSHKELRFIFPIAGQIPVIACFGLARLGEWRFHKALRAVIGLLILFDLGVLLVVSLKPAVAQIGFYQAVYRHEPPVLELYHSELDPYAPFKVPLGFYRPPGLIERDYRSPEELRSHLRPDRDLWLFYENFELTGPDLILASDCRLEYTTYPAILGYLTFLAGPRRFANRWSLYRCRL